MATPSSGAAAGGGAARAAPRPRAAAAPPRPAAPLRAATQPQQPALRRRRAAAAAPRRALAPDDRRSSSDAPAAAAADDDDGGAPSTSGRHAGDADDAPEAPPRFSLPFHTGGPSIASGGGAAAASPEGPAAAGGVADPSYLAEYSALQAQLLDNTRKAGGALGLYLLLTVDGQATLWCMAGTAASCAYLKWLFHDVDAVRPTDAVPIWEANRIENPALRALAKAGAAYQAGLRPRLLVLVALAAGVAVYNKVAPQPLPLVYQGCLLGGFLAYKVALLVKLADELTPKSFMPQGGARPQVERLEDELDQWGRPKKRLASPIDVMPEDAQQKALQQLQAQDAPQEGGSGEQGQQQRRRQEG